MRQSQRAMAVTAMFATLGAGFLPGTAFAHDEDHTDSTDGTGSSTATTDGLVDHSSMHYELTRALLYAAGFSKDDAELIAVADQATDLGSAGFTGSYNSATYGAKNTHKISVVVTGTERTSGKRAAGPQTYFYHFPRRAKTNTVSWSYIYYPAYTSLSNGKPASPGHYNHDSRNTCDFFTALSSTDTCTVNGQAAEPELSQIERWALSGTNQPTQGMGSNTGTLPTLAATVNGLQVSGADPKWTMVRLGIYLHSLTDSFSHEAAMQVAAIRTHPAQKASKIEENIATWHDPEEFGASSSSCTYPNSKAPLGCGVPFTLEAAMSIYVMAPWAAKNAKLTVGGARMDYMTTYNFVLGTSTKLNDASVSGWAQFDSRKDRDAKANGYFLK